MGEEVFYACVGFFFFCASAGQTSFSQKLKKSPVMSERVPYLTVTSQEVPYSLSNFTGSIRKGNCWASSGLEPTGRKWPHASMYYDFTRWLTAGGYFVMEEGHYSINRPVYYCHSLIYMLTKLKWPGCLKLLFAKEWLGFFFVLCVLYECGENLCSTVIMRCVSVKFLILCSTFNDVSPAN